MNIKILDKEFSKDMINKYNEVIGNEVDIFKLNIQWVVVWNGCGTINCHSYPAIVGETNVVELVKDVYEILAFLKDVKFLDKNTTDWSIINNDLIEVNKSELNLTTLISFLILLYGKQKASFVIGKIYEKEFNIEK